MSNTNKGGNVKGGNVNINIGDKEKQGYYVGSASNMARLFILISVVFGVLVGYMHVYKTDPKNMAHAFAEAFFSAEDGVAITEAVEISPYPKQNKKEINKNDD